MVKAHICDICYFKHGRKVSLGTMKSTLKIPSGKMIIDYCPDCAREIPNDKVAWLKLEASLRSKEISDAEAKRILSEPAKPRQKGRKCKYCGEPNGSSDPDLLCSECAETFGHSRYSEL